jgi:hypothetical protein
MVKGGGNATPCFTYFSISRLNLSHSPWSFLHRLPTEVTACLNGLFHQYLLMEIKGSDRGEEGGLEEGLEA